jgi:uncharacterized protein (TIGR03083 family)
MGASAVEIWQVVHTERHRLAGDLTPLVDEQWRTASLCPGWEVHDVLAHLVDTAKTTRLSLMRDMLAARGNFDRANFDVSARSDEPVWRRLASFGQAKTSNTVIRAS